MHSYYKKLWHIYLSGRFYAGGGNESLSVRVLSESGTMYLYACTDPGLSRKDQPALLDRIDLCVEAGRVDYENLTEQKKGEASAEIRMRVCRVRNLQKERYEGKKIRRNTQLEGGAAEKILCIGNQRRSYDASGI